MGKISDTFARLRAQGEGALVTFVTAGDPETTQLKSVLGALTEGGADLIEVGIPFSDPIADGPVIQESSQRSLDRGTKLADVFEALTGFDGPPIVLMGYMNSILRHGMDKFCQLAREAGVSGVIVCDLTPDAAGHWVATARRHGLDTIFLAAPNSTDERLDLVCENSSGFVYAQARLGVTGLVGSPSDDGRRLVQRLGQRCDTPVCVGFGISSPDNVREVCTVAQGAIVGSWLVDLLHRTWDGGKGRHETVAAVRRLKDATR